MKERRYSDKLVRGQILKARKFLRSKLLNKRKGMRNNNRFIFNVTYHPVLLKVKNIPSEIHLLITPNRKHGKIFERISIVGFRRAKILKDILVRAKVAPLEKKKDSSRSFSTQREYWIKLDNLNCHSNKVVYLFLCKTSFKQYPGSKESFQSRFNNYKSAHRNLIKGNTVKQASFHTHFDDDRHHGMSYWEITLID